MRIQFRLIQSFLRRKHYYWLMASILVLFSSCLTDIRTSYMLDDGYDKDFANEEGLKWIEQMNEAHRTYNYEKLESYSLAFTDEYYGLSGAIANPHQTKHTAMELHLIPGAMDSRADFKDGHVWVLQSWRSFAAKAGEDILEVNSNKIKFWLATYQYFIELPYRMKEGSVIRFAGEEFYKGKLCSKVFVSWEQEKPTKAHDQYVLWIEVATGHLVLVQFTIRDMLLARKGVAYYEGYEWMEDMLIPAEIEVRTNLKAYEPLHKMNILKFYPNKKALDYIRIKENLLSPENEIK